MGSENGELQAAGNGSMSGIVGIGEDSMASSLPVDMLND